MVNSALTNTTVEFHRSEQASLSAGIAYVSYSVVQCYENEFTVQSGTITIDRDKTSYTAQLPTAVDLSSSLVLVTAATDDSNSRETSGLVTGALQDTTTVIAQRSVASTVSTEVKYQVVTFSGATDVAVQTNEVTLASGAQSTVETLATSIDPDKTWVYCSYDADPTSIGLSQSSVACDLTDPNKVTIQRYAAAAYTNRVRYYVVTWPHDTVTVTRSDLPISGNPEAEDGDRVNDKITIPAVDDIAHAFSYVTTTVKGTSTEFPRNRWLNYLLDTTTLLTSFWRSDQIYDSDAYAKYWQVISFPAPYQVTGWGWIGSSADDLNGTALISFSCDNLSSCSSQEYGVSLEHGGCGTVCDVTGTAWIGLHDNNDTSSDGKMYTLGIITFDPVVSDTNPPPLGDDTNTVEDESDDAHWNEETGELYGWARFTALEDYEKNNADVASTLNNWGWLKLRGQVKDSETEYGVHFDPATKTFSGWAWNDNGTKADGTTELEGSGFGWVQFDLETSGTVSQAWLKTSQGDVYSQGGINVSVNPADYGDYGSTYLILADGSVTNFNSEYASISEDTDLGTVPLDYGNNVYRGAIGTIHLNELIDHPTQHPLYVYNGDCTDAWLNQFTNPLGGAVYYCTGDMTINNNLTFYNATGSLLGSGTIVVGGDLYINDNLGYYNDTIDQNINNLASVAFIVQGHVAIDPGVTDLVGAYIILGDADPTNSGIYDFSTGSGNAPLELAGVVMARSFNFQRTSLGTAAEPQPAEHISYDGRIFANTPPGLEDLAAVLPSFD